MLVAEIVMIITIKNELATAAIIVDIVRVEVDIGHSMHYIVVVG